MLFDWTSDHWTQGLLLPLLPSNLAKGPCFGLQEEYKTEDEILKSFVQKTAATGPPSFVWVAWQGVQQETPELDNIDDFVSYFDRTWINGQFRLQQWNYYNYNGPRTNNRIVWHSQLRLIVGKPHPNIFGIIYVIKKEQATTEMKLEEFDWKFLNAFRKVKVVLQSI